MERREPSHTVDGNVLSFHEILKIDLHLIQQPHPAYIQNRFKKIIIWKDICTPVFITALFTIAKTWKQLKCPSTDNWFKKMWRYIYICDGILLSHKKNKSLSFAATWMNLEIFLLNERKTEKDEDYVISLICGV